LKKFKQVELDVSERIVTFEADTLILIRFEKARSKRNLISYAVIRTNKPDRKRNNSKKATYET
jgi:hypothetical protein